MFADYAREEKAEAEGEVEREAEDTVIYVPNRKAAPSVRLLVATPAAQTGRNPNPVLLGSTAGLAWLGGLAW